MIVVHPDTYILGRQLGVFTDSGINYEPIVDAWMRKSKQDEQDEDDSDVEDEPPSDE